MKKMVLVLTALALTVFCLLATSCMRDSEVRPDDLPNEAVSTPKHYQIIFSRPDDASGGMTAINATYGQEVTLPECTFVKEKWHFVEYMANGKSYRAGDVVVVHGDMVLEAIFEPDTDFTFTANVGQPVKVTFLDGKHFVAFDMKSVADLQYFIDHGYRALVKVSYTVDSYNRAEIFFGIGTANERVDDMSRITSLSETVFRTYTGTFIKHDLEGTLYPHLESDVDASSFQRFLYFAFDVDSGVCEWVPTSVYAVVQDIVITVEFYR